MPGRAPSSERSPCFTICLGRPLPFGGPRLALLGAQVRTQTAVIALALSRQDIVSQLSPEAS